MTVNRKRQEQNRLQRKSRVRKRGFLKSCSDGLRRAPDIYMISSRYQANVNQT